MSGANADADGGGYRIIHREVHVVVAGGSAADHFGTGQFCSLGDNWKRANTSITNSGPTNLPSAGQMSFSANKIILINRYEANPSKTYHH